MRGYFDLSYGADLYGFILQKNVLPYYFSCEKSEFKDIFFALEKEIKEKREYYELYIKSYLRILVPFMLRNNLIADMSKNVEKNYMQPISLSDCCEEIGMTKFELCRKFKNVTGRTLTEYINYVRILLAKQFLQKNKNSTDTAFLCGFSYVQYFSLTFKKFTGHTSGEYKNHGGLL